MQQRLLGFDLGTVSQTTIQKIQPNGCWDLQLKFSFFGKVNLENRVLYVAFTMGKASSLDLSTDFCKSAFHGGLVSHMQNVLYNFNGHQYWVNRCVFFFLIVVFDSSAVQRFRYYDDCG